MTIEFGALIAGVILLGLKALVGVLWHKEKRQESALNQLTADHNEFKLKVSEQYATKTDFNEAFQRIDSKLDKIFDRMLDQRKDQ